MKALRPFQLPLLYVTLLGLMLLSCNTTKEVTGVTETGNTTVVGVVVDSDGAGIENITLNLRPSNYLPGERDNPSHDSSLLITVKTKKDGFFEFLLPEDFEGNYSLEGLRADSSEGVFFTDVILEGQRNDWATLKLEKTIALSGHIFMPPSNVGSNWVQLRGTERVVLTDDSTGKYIIRNLSPGNYTVMSGGLNPKRDTASLEFHLSNDTTANAVNLLLGTASEQTIGGFSGRVAFPGGEMGSFDIELGESPIFIDRDSSTGFFKAKNVPVGDYTLIARGIEPPSIAIHKNIVVKSGVETTDILMMLDNPLPGAVSGFVEKPLNTKGLYVATLQNTPYQVNVDQEGNFLFNNIPIGKYTLMVYGINPFRDTLFLDSVEVVSQDTTDVPPFVFPIKALIVDGINNHAWEYISQSFIDILDETGLFQVDNSTSPPQDASASDWAAWRPEFLNYDVVISNYNSAGEDPTRHPWPREVQLALENFVSAGGGLITTHGTFPSHAGWWGFEQMKGLLWRGDSLPGIILDSLGGTTVVPAGERGPSIARNYVVPTKMITVNQSHPITNGLPEVWLHPPEGLIFNLKGSPDSTLDILVSTKYENEDFYAPQIWTMKFGEGRVYNIALGDVTLVADDEAIRCVGFQTYFIRGVEWASTGIVSYPVPDNFPDTNAVSLNSNIGN